jgi:hypothetical protein
MMTYAPFDRDQAFLLPPDLKDWLPWDDIARISSWRRSGFGWASSGQTRRPAVSRNTTRG